MKTILYATDYSENSVAALKFAYALSKELDAELLALHVFDMPLTLASTVSHTYSRREIRAFADHRKKLVAFCSGHLKEKTENLDITWKIDEDNSPSASILKNAIELQTDLIVVGIKGGNPVRKVFLGSTTTDLIDSAPCPVLAVPEDTDFKGIRTMVYATDFEGADIFTIEKMVQLAQPFGAHIHLVHVSAKTSRPGRDQMEWFKGMLKHRVDYENIRFELRHGDDVFGTLQDYINTLEPDMVAMLEREGHGLVKDLGHLDLVKRMKNQGQYPLLSYHKKNVRDG